MSRELTPAQIQALESVPGWRWLPAWDGYLEELRQFVIANGRQPNESAETVEERRLANWCMTQKRQKRSQDNDKIAGGTTPITNPVVPP
jgi:hypothetical protein